jgi:VanZ family protein
MHKTSAWPLALIYSALIVYASLYPFADWRDQGIAPWAFLAAPLPRYWTGFDVTANALGYAPLGFFLALSSLRSGGAGRPGLALGKATGAAAALALLMETLQSYLPARVPSNVDFGLNLAGALGGAALACALEKFGAIDHWSRFRARWFEPDARGALVLLALWPAALLFPASVPLGLGQVLERAEEALAEALVDTPFLNWMPLREIELQPMMPATELLCVLLGAVVPCLLGYCVIRPIGKRLVFGALALATGVAATGLSAALTYGPTHAWTWLTLPVGIGLQSGMVLAALLLPVPQRVCAALLLLALAVHMGLLNQAPTGAYLAQTLQTWEQGRFIRFNGLAQWLGWLWPYAAMGYVLVRLSSSDGPTGERAKRKN